MMKFGLSTVTRGIFSSREAYMAVARAAERAGFDFLSVSDHLVVPANLHMAIHQVHPAHAPAWMGQPSPLALWLRLPVQGLLVLWAWWHTHD